MRPLVLVLTLAIARLATAQQPIAPAAEQADDAEAPRAVTLPPPRPLAVPSGDLQPRTGPLLLPPPQPGWRYRVTDSPPTTHRRWDLITAGLVTFSVAWCANLQAGVATQEWRLDVPMLGPLLEIQRIGNDSPLAGFVNLMLVSDAVVQIGGFAMIIAGARSHETKLGRQRIELVPLGAGAAVRGSF